MAPEAAVKEPPTPAAAPATPAAPAAEAPAQKPAAKGKGKDGKDVKGKKEKKGAKGAEQVELAAAGPTVAAHPRAARAVAQAKSWGGLIGFALTGYLSLSTSTVAEAMLRALVAGLVCYVATWAGALFLWRRLVVLELKGREQKLHAALDAARSRRELPPGPPERPATTGAA
jgi:pyruvate/2-oxoglutarate dehydrogenase complex dihydrolipoamide acyltransferase (E2) component